MKNQRLTLGIALVLIGFLWLLGNLNLIDINLSSIFSHLMRGIFDLWPLILVIIGVSIIFKNDLLNNVMWVLFLALLIIYSLFIKDNIMEKNLNKPFEVEVYTSEMREDIEEGRLNLDIGATNFTIDSIDDKFIKLEQDGAFEYRFTNKGFIENFYISSKDEYFRNVSERRFDLRLNNEIPWEIHMDMGAISGNLNLEDIIVDKIDLDMGAGSLEMTLGEKNDLSLLDIDAGASKLIINIPKGTGVTVELDGALNSTNLDSLDLEKTSRGKYISKDYDEASTKYEMEVDMGVGNFEINYY